MLIALDPENKVDMHEVLEPLNLELQGRDAGQRSGVRAPHPPGQRPRQPRHRDLHLAPVGDDAGAPGRARARRSCRGPGGSTPSATAPPPSRSTPRSRRTTRRSSTRTATSSPTRARSGAPGSWRRPRSRRTRACSCSPIRTASRDEAIRAAANELLALDVIHWLMGDESLLGRSRRPRPTCPITHTRKQDVLWFYSTIFLAPALVIGPGVAVTQAHAAAAPARGGGPSARRAQRDGRCS